MRTEIIKSLFGERLSFSFLFFLHLILVSEISTININKEGCGQFKVARNGRVIGGDDAAIEEFPWQVSLQKITLGAIVPIPHFKHLCGASILNHDWLLTAAHCVDGYVIDLICI